MSKKSEDSTLVLRYDLFELPTAQHKAGLAGLLLMIESMKRRRLSPVPEVQEVSASSARIAFTRESMQAMFNDLYAAARVEIDAKQKWRGKPPKRTLEKKVEDGDGKEKTEKRYVYDIVQPTGGFLQALYPDGDGVWVKLWRDMLWRILRGIPTTRGVYEERANGEASSLAPKTWAALTKSRKAREKGQPKTESIVSSLFIGAQDSNAEKVPFVGVLEENLLLHFWTLVSLIYVPRTVSRDGHYETVGYVLAVPEPAHLKDFMTDVVEALMQLNTEIWGYLPRSALIDLPEEGGLEYLYHLAQHRTQQNETFFSTSAIELWHLQKKGNNIRALAAERILPSTRILDQYGTLRHQCHNPLYKAQRIRNLLAGQPWHVGMDGMCSEHPFEFFIFAIGETPTSFPSFGLDVERMFRSIEHDLELQKGGPVSDQETDDRLARRVYQLTRAYVRRRTEEKSGIPFDVFQKTTNEAEVMKYREANEKVCSDAFLAMRGRRDADFVEYFTGTLCSVPQYMPELEYLEITRALMRESGWQTVKTLSMLALSAHSNLWRPNGNKGGNR